MFAKSYSCWATFFQETLVAQLSSGSGCWTLLSYIENEWTSGNWLTVFLTV
uniref:Uncharacterized protein n=1 Tax=Anguilla anguilla TaxID=7936 RepID=A0A0E9QT67_ANGAN